MDVNCMRLVFRAEQSYIQNAKSILFRVYAPIACGVTVSHGRK